MTGKNRIDSKLLSGAEVQQATKSMQAAHRPSIAIAGPYGRPIHHLLAMVAVGAWVCTLAFDVASKLSDGRSYARAAVWLCAVGLVFGVLALVSGFVDGRRLTAETNAFQTARSHMFLMLGAFALFLVSFVIRRVDSSSITYLENGTPGVAMAITAVGIICLGIGVLQGSKLVYMYGVRVVDESDQIFGHVVIADDEIDLSTSSGTAQPAVPKKASTESTT